MIFSLAIRHLNIDAIPPKRKNVFKNQIKAYRFFDWQLSRWKIPASHHRKLGFKGPNVHVLFLPNAPRQARGYRVACTRLLEQFIVCMLPQVILVSLAIAEGW